LRKVARVDFIINSPEFQIFARPNGDIEKILKSLPKLPTVAIIERMHENTDIKERMYDLTEKERFNNIIIEFTYFAKKVLPQLKIMRK
jgi:hypothetical protein